MLENSQVEPATVESGASAPRAATARARLAAAVLRRHWLAAVLLAAGLVLRLLAQFAYRPVLFYIDTARYLYNDAQGMDPVGYKGPLRVLLAVAEDDEPQRHRRAWILSAEASTERPQQPLRGGVRHSAGQAGSRGGHYRHKSNQV